jgi:hypothetical protein
MRRARRWGVQLEVSFLFSINTVAGATNETWPQVCERWLRRLRGAASTFGGFKNREAGLISLFQIGWHVPRYWFGLYVHCIIFFDAGVRIFSHFGAQLHPSIGKVPDAGDDVRSDVDDFAGAIGSELATFIFFNH